uniref:Uncharacterized protein n=1 Tax=Davidia involucrata TaxID=16924 RepID=A0A5B7B891_DAVIN
MVFSTLKFVAGPFPPAAGPNESHVKGPTLTMVKRPVLHLQVRNMEEQNLQAPKALTAASRRDAMLCLTAASLSGVTLFLAEPAEARVVKPEIRRKIMDKLKMLREKAGLSKPKIEDEETRPPPQSSPKELPPLPNPLKDLAESLVDATLP